MQDVQTAQVLHPYGVGIDVHSKFIQVCVLVNAGDQVHRHESPFQTTWPEFDRALEWIKGVLGPLLSGPLRYCLESTGTYHLPVLMALGGEPSVVNPMLAGHVRRKTDVLDARLLAHHSITGLWPASFLASRQGLELRVLWAQRGEAVRRATRASNRLNNILLRFGHTIGASAPPRGERNRAIVAAMCLGHVPPAPDVCADGLLPDIRPVVARLAGDLSDAAHTVRGKEANEAKRTGAARGGGPAPAGHGPRAPQEDGQD